ncbi:MAG: AbrB/MazE/SpoVT family DNA-binding domain-containing protein [Candidatus Micrarchaeia archaeon]
MNIEIVKLSSKGQLVLPLAIRKHFRVGKGERLMIVEEGGTILLKPLKQMKRDIEEEIYLLSRAAKGWAQVEKGKAKTMLKDEFLRELSAW